MAGSCLECTKEKRDGIRLYSMLVGTDSLYDGGVEISFITHALHDHSFI